MGTRKYTSQYHEPPRSLVRVPFATQLPSRDDYELIKRYLTAALSENTLRSYRSDLDSFIASGGTIPACPEAVAAYLAKHANKHSVATLTRRVVAVGWAHRVRGLPNPTESALVKATLQGIRRKQGQAQRQVSPLLKADLIRMVKGLRGLQGLRDRALLMIGFAAALRRSELISLNVENLQFVREGLIVHLPRSKTDQEGRGRDIAIPYIKGRHCPCKALKSWLAGAGITTGAVFRRVSSSDSVLSGRLSAQSVSLIIKRRAVAVGLNPATYSGHSLRAGFATSAARAGVSSMTIRAQTGHQSDVMLQRYIRYANQFELNANFALWSTDARSRE